jgi:hypothetical protein
VQRVHIPRYYQKQPHPKTLGDDAAPQAPGLQLVFAEVDADLAAHVLEGQHRAARERRARFEVGAPPLNVLEVALGHFHPWAREGARGEDDFFRHCLLMNTRVDGAKETVGLYGWLGRGVGRRERAKATDVEYNVSGLSSRTKKKYLQRAEFGLSGNSFSPNRRLQFFFEVLFVCIQG